MEQNFETPAMLAVSRAGHDRDQLYVVLAEEGDYFWLADGWRRPLDKPKKKKKIHVQIIRHLPESILAQMQAVTADAHVRKVLSEYRRIQSR